ncbi:MAG: hypothetical protein PWP39_496 [Pyrococcus sp.]|nr:hypothetical protein [Pyrococcus sp.]
MKKALVILVVLITMISPIFAVERQLEYEKARENDEGAYIFFSSLLQLSRDVLENLTKENFRIFDEIVNRTIEESSYYESQGIKTKMPYFLPPFITLRNGISKIVEGNTVFITWFEDLKSSKSYVAYTKAKSGIELMKVGVEETEYSLEEIGKLEFIGENGDVKKLDIEDVREELERINSLITIYEKALEKYRAKEGFIIRANEGFIITATDLNPFVLEEVIILGNNPGLKNVYLNISGVIIPINKTGEFSVVYKFSKLGIYTAYASGQNGTSIVKSNMLVFNVTKMPTNILVPEKVYSHIYNVIEISGILVDYFGNPIPNQSISIFPLNVTLKTNKLGKFSFNITSNYPKALEITIVYPGNEIYKGCNSSVRAIFTRIPVNIRISGEERVKKGEIYTVRINSTAKVEPLYVYVDKNLTAVIPFTREFNLTINSPGRHEIYVFFPGNEIYTPARSNTLVVEVYTLPVIEILGILGIVITAVFLLRFSRTQGTKFGIPIKPELLTQEDHETKQISVREAYREVYHSLITEYNLKPSLTPRELYSILSNEPFSRYLKELTAIHEVHVYGMMELTRAIIGKFFRALSNFIVTKVLGGEL